MSVAVRDDGVMIVTTELVNLSNHAKGWARAQVRAGRWRDDMEGQERALFDAVCALLKSEGKPLKEPKRTRQGASDPCWCTATHVCSLHERR